jgi:PHD/YefM family antitoxin component YafN of YafNO toxin-antitoxin module
MPLSPEIRAAIGADVVIDRVYRNSPDAATEISAHLAVFSDWNRGIYHHPFTAYRANGWTLLNQTRESVSAAHGRSVPVSLSEWESKSRGVLVLFWYQLGDHVLFERSELDELRAELPNQERPPRLVKVLLQIGGSRTVVNKAALEQLAGETAKWLDRPYYDPWMSLLGRFWGREGRFHSAGGRVKITLGLLCSRERTCDVTTLTTSEASKRLDEVLDSLAESHGVVQIAGQRHCGILVSEDDWRAIQETLYLTSVAGMKESIAEGLRTPLDQCAEELDW